MPESARKPAKTIQITIDGEDFEVDDRDTTPRELLVLAGLDPTTTYLIELRGDHQEPLQEQLDEPLKLHPHMRFISADVGPAPVA